MSTKNLLTRYPSCSSRHRVHRVSRGTPVSGSSNDPSDHFSVAARVRLVDRESYSAVISRSTRPARSGSRSSSRFILTLMLNRRVRGNTLLEGERCSAVDSSQTQNSRSTTQSATHVERVLFKLFTLKSRTDFRQATQHCIALPFREPEFFLNLDHACRAQRHASGSEARLPYINIPTR